MQTKTIIYGTLSAALAIGGAYMLYKTGSDFKANEIKAFQAKYEVKDKQLTPEQIAAMQKEGKELKGKMLKKAAIPALMLVGGLAGVGLTFYSKTA